MKLDDQDLLPAAQRALDELTRRERDTLEQLLVDHKPIEEIARASLIAIERAAFWIEGARTKFRDKLRAQLERLGEAELGAIDELELLGRVLRMTRPAATAVPVADPVARCPKCSAAFADPSGQFATYAKLAAEGRLGLMIGCTACSLLFVPLATTGSTRT